MKMAQEIIRQFMIYFKGIEGQFYLSDVDLTPLIEQTRFNTPIPLKYSDPQTAFSNMSCVIIQNLCKYADNSKYPKYGLDAIKSIITKDANDEDTRAQLMILVHFTKMKLSIYESAMFYKCFERMRIKTEYTEQLTAWKDVAHKVLKHNGVNNTINDIMKQTFGIEYSQRIEETASIKVSIKFVNTTEDELRGFAGINCVYINEGCFKLKAFQLQNNSTLSEVDIEKILLMDIVTVTIHEYSHVRIRQVLDDLNMCSPNFIAETAAAIDSNDLEFGRIVERKFFHGTVNWVKSIGCGAVEITYVTNFVDGIKTNAALPVLPNNPYIVTRTRPQMMNGGGGGADMSYVHDRMIE